MMKQLLMDPGILGTDTRDDEDDAVVHGCRHSRYRYQRR